MAGGFRRFYLYSALSIAVLAIAIALTNLISLVLRMAGLSLTYPSDVETRSAVALTSAILLVAVPVGAVHYLIIRRSLVDPEERVANVRHFYLNFWIFVALVVALLMAQFLANSTAPGIVGDRATPLAAAIVAAVIGILGWRWRATTPPRTLRWENDAAYGAMVIALIIGLSQLAVAVDGLVRLGTAEPDLGPPARGFPGRLMFLERQVWIGSWTFAAAMLVWATCAVWQRTRRTQPIRLRYLVTFFGLGVAVVAAFLDLELAALARRALGHGSDRDATTFIPQLAVGLVLVALHTPLLVSDRGRNGRAPETADRLLAVPVAIAAVALLAAAAVQTWTFVVDHVFLLGGSDDPADHAAAAAVSAVLGSATYPLSWRTLRAGAAGDQFRRFAVFTVVCLALAGGVIAAATALFELISGLLAGSFAQAGVHRLVTWSGIAVIAFAVFALHLAMLRRDRRGVAAAVVPSTAGADGCLVCQRIATIRAGSNPTFIARTPNAYAVLGDEQYLRGYSLILWPEHVEHLHELPPEARARFLSDMALLGGAMWRALRPARLNYMIAGGLVPHLHAHVFARWADEPAEYREGPVGAYPRDIRDAPENAFDAERHASLIRAIAGELKMVDDAGAPR